METAKAVPITERLRAIKIGSFSIDEGSHSKHFAVGSLCREAAAEIERSNERERQLYGECLLLADILRDAYGVVKTIEGEEQDECDKLTGLCLSMAHALALYDERRIETPNAEVSGGAKQRPLERPVSGFLTTQEICNDAEKTSKEVGH